LRAMGGQLYTVMAELFSNAFEHGVLGLSSSLKATPQGFMEYYRQREERLDGLVDGFVRIHMQHRGDGRSGELILRIEDSGPGFDYQEVLERKRRGGGNEYSGRGLRLIDEICDSLQYIGIGNQVEAVIRWPRMTEGRD
jgi:signal transduction histidine kinase